MVGRWIRRGLVILAAIAAGADPASRARGLTRRWRAAARPGVGLGLPHALPPRTRGGKPRLQRDHPPHYADRRAPRGEGPSRPPLSVASRIEVQLPWSVFRRRFAIDHLDDRPAASSTSFRDKNNVVNLPPSSNAPTPERARRLDIRVAHAERARRAVRGQFRNWGVKVPRIESELLNTALGAKGNFARPRQARRSACAIA